jgi:light-regulated signal transduction histidine kinase (bacteriophytochrome)
MSESEPSKLAGTALRESEERFRLLFAGSPAPMWVYDADTLRFLEVNDAAVRAYGYSREEFLAMTVRDVRPAEDLEQHRLKDGRLIDVESRTHTLQLAGRPAVLVVALDVTARTRAEQELRGATEALERRVAERTAELEAANRDLEAFSYSVSHDLRAPLRAIDGFGQALLQDYRERLDDQGRDYLTRMCNAGRRMAGLIDDLLTLSRAGRAEMRRSPVDLGEIARSVLEGLRQREPGRRVEAVVADGLTTSGDPRLLRLLMENLIGNAWKFTGQREHARIEVGAVARDGGRVFFVRDNGAGFDMAYVGRLFVPFQRLHSPAQFAGNGVGLATVRRIVRRHGGEVWAEGAVEGGATLYFTL